MADTASLLEKFGSQDASGQAVQRQAVQQQMMRLNTQWTRYGVDQNCADQLQMLQMDAPAAKTKEAFLSNPGLLKACFAVFDVQDGTPTQWFLTLFYEMLREDSSCFIIFEDAMKAKIDVYKPLVTLLERKKGDLYICDRAAWVISSVMSHLPRFFNQSDIEGFLSLLLAKSEAPGSELAVGTLEAIVNLLKADTMRPAVLSYPGVSEHIFGVQVKSAQSQVLYKYIYAIWMLSFDAAMVDELKQKRVVARIRDTLVVSRVEKVVRMCLTVLKNLLVLKPLCEDIVESNILDAVQSVEYEKWRDAELYDDIREVAQLISNKVQEVSNFERYERELNSGKLTWSAMHTSKFWGENVMKFEQNDFAAIKKLRDLLLNDETDATTLAVACHDIGEFVALHPLGKKQIGKLFIKERVMELMGATSEDMREVRREALLCCQKIMLNKWQDMEKAK